MTEVERLEQYAHDHDIQIIKAGVANHVALSCRYGGKAYIFLDTKRLQTEPEMIQALSHEIAHIETDSFSSSSDQFVPIGQMEQRTWKRVIEQYLPRYTLEAVMASCDGRVWEVAEELGVPESLVRRAVNYYATKYS